MYHIMWLLSYRILLFDIICIILPCYFWCAKFLVINIVNKCIIQMTLCQELGKRISRMNRKVLSREMRKQSLWFDDAQNK